MTEDRTTEIALESLRGPQAPTMLSLDPAWDRLTVIEYGSVWDGQLPEEFGALEEDERVQFLLRADEDGEVDEGSVIALMVHEPFDVDPAEIDADEFWEGPRFDVPLLGLRDASPGEILLAVQGRFGKDEATADAAFFHMAMAAKESGEEGDAVGLWQMAIEAGDMKGRFGLGYTLHDLGRYREAYDQLRLYTEITPRNSWAWCWLGKTCAELGFRAEATSAYERAVELEAAGGLETDAEELLEALGSA